MEIPFVDLKAQYLSIKPEIDEAIQTVLNECAFYKGRHVEEFEERFAGKIGAKHCISVANATDGLEIAVQAVTNRPFEGLTAANTFIATSEAITNAGGIPAFIDIDPITHNIDSDLIEDCIFLESRVILPVHFYGRSCEMEPILKIAREHDLFIVEDCAQAVFAKDGNKYVGTIGDVGVFSFYPGKNLGAMGDAGAVVTNDDKIAEKVRMIADHGRLDKYDHIIEGKSSRMDGLQAAILNVKLKYIDEWNDKRYENALLYKKHLEGTQGLLLPDIPERSRHVFHLFVIRVSKTRRDDIRTYLYQSGISTGIHYPVALPNTKAYQYLRYNKEDFPVASRFQDEILSLPMYPELTEEQIVYVAEKLKEALQ